MTRFKFCRTLRFDSLEGRQLLSTTGPAAHRQEQYMLQLINEARTNPAAAGPIRSPPTLLPNVHATLQYYNVNLQTAVQTIASATPQPPLPGTPIGKCGPGPEPVSWQTTRSRPTPVQAAQSPQQRMQAAGYSNITSSAENAYAYRLRPEEAMQAFLIDWGVPSDGTGSTSSSRASPAQNAYQRRRRRNRQTSPNNPSFGPMVITQDFASQLNLAAEVGWQSPVRLEQPPDSIRRARDKVDSRSTPSIFKPDRLLQPKPGPRAATACASGRPVCASSPA